MVQPLQYSIRLNPCFSGCWSRTALISDRAPGDVSLNPCFSGCWSRTASAVHQQTESPLVLILVLVDVGLGPARRGTLSIPSMVLILVLVDVGLGLAGNSHDLDRLAVS